MKLIQIIVLACFSNAYLFTGIGQESGMPVNFKGKQRSIYETEMAFQQMIRESGVQTAFLSYADDRAVLNRNGVLVEGKEAIAKFYGTSLYEQAKVKWVPKQIVMAKSGDLAYSYGAYIWWLPDSSGKLIEYPGIYMTIWKLQPNGNWKYVWD